MNRFASITEGAVHRDTLGFRAWQRMVSFSSMQRRQSSRVASRSEPLHRSLAQVRDKHGVELSSRQVDELLDERLPDRPAHRRQQARLGASMVSAQAAAAQSADR